VELLLIDCVAAGVTVSSVGLYMTRTSRHAVRVWLGLHQNFGDVGCSIWQREQ